MRNRPCHLLSNRPKLHAPIERNDRSDQASVDYLGEHSCGEPRDEQPRKRRKRFAYHRERHGRRSHGDGFLRRVEDHSNWIAFTSQQPLWEGVVILLAVTAGASRIFTVRNRLDMMR